jgi:type II secretory pathway pseudopilin PulG
LSLRRGQAGAAGALLLAILVIVIVVLVALQVLSRTSDVSREEANATIGLQRAVSALEGYAATAQRLPCPAQPDADTGLEVTETAVKCQYPEGTIPWATIGMKRDDAIDPWGRKLSYRVYSGGADSLTQAGGVSMVNCDIGDTGAAIAGGLCNPGATIYDRNTSPANFLAGKGYKLTDMSPPQVSDVAYVILSHGSTGYGGYTVSGARLELPKGDEKKNTNASGEFNIHPHSDNDVEANANDHFDDLVVYRRLDDLVKRIGLYARDWAEYGAGTSSVPFSAATIGASIGTSVAPGADLGRSTLAIGNTRVSGETGTSTPTNLAYDTTGTFEGIGVAGGGSTAIQSSAGEFVRLDFVEGWKRFGITLNDFGTYSSTFTEKVELRFYLDAVAVGPALVFSACRADGGQASFSAPVNATFNRVDIVPLPADNTAGSPGITSFYIGEIVACSSTSAECRTSVDTVANRCP